VDWLWWAPLGVAALHIVEEFVFPGGFAAWDRQYRPKIRSSITPRFHVILNAVLLVVCTAVALAPRSPRSVAAWLTLAALLFGNAVFHLVGALATKRYSPGVATGIVLYVPLAVVGYWRFLSTGAASVGTALMAVILGGSYQAWSTAMHTLRARRAQA
jgi:hypothetical protein